MECPYIERDIDTTSNKPIDYKAVGGKVNYIFYDHTDPDGNVSRVQFCKFKGRKKDVFQCLNENEWKDCSVFLHNKKGDS